MKRILITITIALGLLSCDQISEENYFEEVDVEINYTNRNVILLEMTAFQCNNCPPASKEAERIIKQHNGKVIGMNVHASSLARPQKKDDPILATEASESLWEKAGSPALPAGMINYYATSTNFNNSFGSWAVEVIRELEKETHLNMELTASPTGENEFDLTVELSYVGKQLENERLGVFLIEDGVIGRQIDGSDEILDYEHNHITRENIVNLSGVKVFNDLNTGDTWSQNYSFEIGESVLDPTNTRIVAFVFNEENDYIYQASELVLY